MEQTRKKINKIDAEIVHLLAKRCVCVKKIGKYKKEHSLKIYQPKREREVLAEKAKLAKKFGLNQGLINKLYKLIMKDSRRIQNRESLGW